MLDAQIHVAPLHGDSLAEGRLVSDSGFAPVVAPTGDRVAFLRMPSSAGLNLPELRVAVPGDESRMLTDRVVMPTYREIPPLGFESEPFVWSPDGTRLYLVQEEPDGDRIVAGLSPDGGPPVEYDRVSRPASPGDLSVDPSGARLAWVVNEPGGSHEIRITSTDGGGGIDVLHVDDAAVGLVLAGWLGSRGPIVALRWFVGLARVESVEAILVHLDGRIERLPAVSGAIASQAVLDPRGRLLVPTAVNGRTGLMALDLRGGRNRVWQLALDDVPVSAPRMTPDGRVLFARHSVNADIWLFRFVADDGSPNTGGIP